MTLKITLRIGFLFNWLNLFCQVRQNKPKQRVGLTTHFATHHEKSVDLQGKNNDFYSFNPFVVGSTPAGPTKIYNENKDLEKSKSFFLA
jgi:hypothetical protein